jgi:aspartyl-tRNA(Asn)/glutamyl-tRNA(Gln) amidotransferase subunit A
MALSWTLDKIGPICRSADDCGIVLAAIAGGDSRDPGSAGKGFYYAPQYARKPGQIRVGFAPVDIGEWAEPSARPAFQAAMQVIKSTGAPMKEATLQELPYGMLTGWIIDAEGAAIFEPLIASGKVDELSDAKQIAGLKAALEISAKDYLKAMRIRRVAQDAFRKLFIDYDVLVSPARMGPATKLTQALDRPASDRPRPKERGLSELIPAGNLAGLPALCLPCGFADGLPVALQLVGRPFTESALLALGAEFQNRTDWHKRRPQAA